MIMLDIKRKHFGKITRRHGVNGLSPSRLSKSVVGKERVASRLVKPAGVKDRTASRLGKHMEDSASAEQRSAMSTDVGAYEFDQPLLQTNDSAYDFTQPSLQMDVGAYDFARPLLQTNDSAREFAQLSLQTNDSAYVIAQPSLQTDANEQEASRLMKLMMDTAPICSMLWDENCNIFDCNEESIKLFKMEDKDDFISHFFDLSPKYQPDGLLSIEKAAKYIRKTFEIGRICMEWMHQLLDGTPIPCEMTLIRVMNRENRIIAAYARDLREQKQIMSEILQLQSDLKVALKEAQNANAAKTAFLANMSHEIRTPLNAVVGLSELLLDSDKLEDEIEERLEKIHASGLTILGIVNDVLDISKIESGKFEIIPVEYDTPSLINDTVTLNIVRIGEKPLKFNLVVDETLPGALVGDDLRIKQIFNNLLSNAFKYTNSGSVVWRVWSEIVVSGVADDNENILNDNENIWNDNESKKRDHKKHENEKHDNESKKHDHKKHENEKHDNDNINDGIDNKRDNENKLKENIWLVAVVEDSGIGIKPEDLKKLFSEYNQVDIKTNRQIEGSGLGLAITKRLVEMMGGTISVQSEYGRGTAFEVRIPQKLVKAKPIGKEVADNLMNSRYTNFRRAKNSKLARIDLSYARVLVVDDMPTNLEVVKGMLKPYHLKVDCSTSGRQAIAMIQEEERRYDAVFMDHMMPGMDGIEATRIIREEIGTEYARNVPIIALTANAILGNEEMFLNNGFQAFISKPIDIMKLDAILRLWVRKKEKEPLKNYNAKSVVRRNSNVGNAETVNIYAENADTVNIYAEDTNTVNISVGNAVRRTPVTSDMSVGNSAAENAFTAQTRAGNAAAENAFTMQTMAGNSTTENAFTAQRRESNVAESYMIKADMSGDIKAGLSGDFDATLNGDFDVDLRGDYDADLDGDLDADLDVGLIEGINIDGLDINKCLECFSGDCQTVVNVLRAYAESTRPLMISLNEKLDAEKLPEYAVIIHGIKGSSYGISASVVGKAAEELEHSAKAGNLYAVKTMHVAFEPLINALLCSLDAFLDTIETKKAFAKSPDQALLSELRDACEAFDMDRIDKVIVKLESFRYEDGGELVMWLRERIDEMALGEIARGEWGEYICTNKNARK